MTAKASSIINVAVGGDAHAFVSKKTQNKSMNRRSRISSVPLAHSRPHKMVLYIVLPFSFYMVTVYCSVLPAALWTVLFFRPFFYFCNNTVRLTTTKRRKKSETGEVNELIIRRGKKNKRLFNKKVWNLKDEHRLKKPNINALAHLSSYEDRIEKRKAHTHRR